MKADITPVDLLARKKEAVRQHLKEASTALNRAAFIMRESDLGVDPEGIALIVTENTASMVENIRTRIR